MIEYMVKIEISTEPIIFIKKFFFADNLEHLDIYIKKVFGDVYYEVLN